MNDLDLPTACRQFITRFLAANRAERASLVAEGQDLADRLRSAAMALCYNQATEFSPTIERLFLGAAQVACLVYEPGSPALAAFERDVFYYAHFDPPGEIVAEYERFRAECAAIQDQET